MLTPTQETDFMGMQVHSQSMKLSLPGQKIKKLHTEATKLLDQVQCSTSHSLGGVMLVREAECLWPSLLQNDPERPSESTEEGRSVIIDTLCPLSEVRLCDIG